MVSGSADWPDDGNRRHTHVVLPFDLAPGDIARFLSVQADGRRFVFQRKQAGRAFTYVWLDGPVIQAASGTPVQTWRAEIERGLSAVMIDAGIESAGFPGGAIGFFSYDALSAARSGATGVQDHDIGCPFVLVAFTRIFAVLDHRAGQGSLVALAPDGADHVAVRADLAARLTAIRTAPAKAASPEEGESWSVDIGKAAYAARVGETQRLIADGAIQQMILSVGLSRRATLDPVSTFQALVHDNPSPHEFLIGTGAFTLIGASPLLHLSVAGRQVTIETDAGTRPAGRTEAESLRHANELLASVKDGIEQKIIAQATLDDLETITTAGSTRVVADREIRRFSQTMHLYTVMQGELRPVVSVLDAMLACAPAAALVGAPKDAAITAIDRIEQTRRGPYGGLVALFGYDGSLDSAVVLRSLWSNGSRVQLRSGGGITAASDADEEYGEAMQKALTVLRAAPNGARIA